MRLPDFLIIGAAKAGTTSLYQQLIAHPAIFMSTPKEPEFFARNDRFSAGIASYSKLFDAARPNQICGEASTIYSLAPLFPDTAGRLHAAIPQAKLIYVLREPVARCYSYYVQLVKNYQNATGDYHVPRSFEACLFPERFPDRAPRERFLAPFDSHLPDTPDLLLAGSHYPMQIRTYLAHFDPDTILFLTFESFLTDRPAVLNKVCLFLGLDPAAFAATPEAQANVSKDHFDRVSGVLAIETAKRRLGPLAGLRKFVPKAARRMAQNLIQRRSGATGAGSDHLPLPMTPETRQVLTERFASERAELSTLTGLSLAAWDLSGGTPP